MLFWQGENGKKAKNAKKDGKTRIKPNKISKKY
jgi:hypothetical protein